jgi:hypothetical protein
MEDECCIQNTVGSICFDITVLIIYLYIIELVKKKKFSIFLFDFTVITEKQNHKIQVASGTNVTCELTI